MPAHAETKNVKGKRKKSATRPVDQEPDNHVPEWAEDMEHTLRRLISERQKKRDQNPGLYR